MGHVLCSVFIHKDRENLSQFSVVEARIVHFFGRAIGRTIEPERFPAVQFSKIKEKIVGFILRIY